VTSRIRPPTSSLARTRKALSHVDEASVVPSFRSVSSMPHESSHTRTKKPANGCLVSCAGKWPPSMGSCTLRRLRKQAATYTGASWPQLCCAFRLSQPLDALFRPYPVRPCFMPKTPLGFGFQSLPLVGSGRASRRRLPLMSSLVPDFASARTAFPPIRLQGFAHPTSPCLQAGVTR
jgi:hypothetical protein